MQTLYHTSIGFFLVISLMGCQHGNKPELAVPENALALLPFSARQVPLPLADSNWHQILMPISQNQSGILYLNTRSNFPKLDQIKGLNLFSSSKWRGLRFEHFRDSLGQNWEFVQIKNIKYLSQYAALVEEAALQLQQKKRATWVLPFESNQIQFNYLALCQFFDLKNPALKETLPTVILQGLRSDQGFKGKMYFAKKIIETENDLSEVLALVPASARSFVPDFEMGSKLAFFKNKIAFFAHFGRDRDSQTALILPFESAEQAQEAQDSLAENKGALPAIQYQTYTIQPTLDLGWNTLPFQQANLLVLDRFLVIGASQHLLERWIDALIVGNTIRKQLRNPPRGMWMRWSKDQDLGYVLHQLNQLLDLKLEWPDVLQWEGNLKENLWEFTEAPNLEPANNSGAELWQMDLSSGKAKGIWSIDAWNQCLLETDQQHLLALDLDGTLSWDKKLDAPVVGSLTPSFQTASRETLVYFATEKSIHAIAANGEEAPGFPLDLNLACTSGLCVGGSEQFLFYACADGRLYGLDHSGAPLSGWNPGPKVGTVKQPLAFFQSASEDYLLALTEYGTLHVLDRATQAHFPAPVLKGPFLSPPQWQWDQYGQQMVVADGQGRAQVYNGAGEGFPLAIAAKESGPSWFCFTDLLGDGRKDYLAANGSLLFLHAYGNNGFKLAFQKSFTGKIVQLTALEGKVFFSIPSQHLVWGLDAKGKTLGGFPMAGDLFAGFPKEKVMVTGVGERVYGFEW